MYWVRIRHEGLFSRNRIFVKVKNSPNWNIHYIIYESFRYWNFISIKFVNVCERFSPKCGGPLMKTNILWNRYQGKDLVNERCLHVHESRNRFFLWDCMFGKHNEKSGFKLLFSMKYEKKSVTNLGVLFILTNEMYLECLQSLQIWL